MKRLIIFIIVSTLAFGVIACGKAEPPEEEQSGGQEIVSVEKIETDPAIEFEEEADVIASEDKEDREVIDEMIMRIGEMPVQVAWEDNESVEALKELVSDSPLTIQMSMYGGFEQVGTIGQSLPRSDAQTTTKAGDIVLYSGNQMVVFYGSNSWAYTRLGHISDKNEEELAQLLGNGDVTITIERTVEK